MGNGLRGRRVSPAETSGRGGGPPASGTHWREALQVDPETSRLYRRAGRRSL